MKFQGKKEMESEKVLRRFFAAAVSLSVNAAKAAEYACERRLRKKYEARKDVIDFVSVGKEGWDYPAILAIALVRVPDAARKE